MKIDSETRRLKRKRRRVMSWGLSISFLLLLVTGCGFFVSLIGAIFFATIARMTVSEELDTHYRTIYLGAKKYGRH